MCRNNKIILHYGYQEGECGIYHAFLTEDINKHSDSDAIGAQLANLLDTDTDDPSFNWDMMDIEVPEEFIERIQYQERIRTLKELGKQFVVDIQWDADMEDVYDALDKMETAAAAKAIECPVDLYTNMTAEERDECAYKACERSRALRDEILGLPEMLEIPNDKVVPEDVLDWLSEEYGYCVEGFRLIPFDLDEEDG